MKPAGAVIFLALLPPIPGSASSLSQATLSVIPAETQQIICLDYRALRASATGRQFKSRLLPGDVRRFEDALRKVGVSPDQDLDQIVVASFRTREHLLAEIAIATGQFPLKKMRSTLSAQNIHPERVSGSLVYAMGNTSVTFLDDWTMLLGDEKAVGAGLQVRGDPSQSLKANSEMTDQIASLDHSPIWSVLDAAGTQLMVKSLLGKPSELNEYDSVKKNLLAARYSLDLAQGADLRLNVITADAVTAATLSTLLKAEILFKKMSAAPSQKQALDDTNVDSDNTRFIMHFTADTAHFQELFDSPAFVTSN